MMMDENSDSVKKLMIKDNNEKEKSIFVPNRKHHSPKGQDVSSNQHSGPEKIQRLSKIDVSAP